MKTIQRRTGRGATLALVLTAILAAEARAQAPAGGADRLPAPTDQLLLVVSRTDATLKVFAAKEDRLTPLRTVPTGKGPDEVVVSPDGKTAYVTNAGDGSITVVDLATLEAARTITEPRLKAPEGPSRAVFSVAPTPDGRKLYVTARAAGAVLVMTPTGEVTKEIRVPDVSTVAIAPDGRRVYAVGDRPQELVAIDTATDAVVGRLKTGRQPKGIAFTPDGKTLVLAAVAHDAVQFVDTATFQVEATIGAGRSPQSPVVTPDGRLAFVGTRELEGGGTVSRVSIIDLRLPSPRQVGSFVVGSMVQKLVVSGDGAYLYVTSTGASDPRDNVLAVDLFTMQIVRFARGGTDTLGMAFRGGARE
jgi:YVTN family beta-propeller protein